MFEGFSLYLMLCDREVESAQNFQRLLICEIKSVCKIENFSSAKLNQRES